MQLDIIDLYPKNERFFTPEQFLKLTEEERKDIAESKIIPPKLGGSSLGGFLIRFKKPIYAMVGKKCYHSKRQMSFYQNLN
ncbi:MAG: hypothetical protein HQK72_07455 [Desulfamplus sp.]|nr:hypothetical protein [Desulfamplus sp.]